MANGVQFAKRSSSIRSGVAWIYQHGCHWWFWRGKSQGIVGGVRSRVYSSSEIWVSTMCLVQGLVLGIQRWLLLSLPSCLEELLNKIRMKHHLELAIRRSRVGGIFLEKLVEILLPYNKVISRAECLGALSHHLSPEQRRGFPHPFGGSNAWWLRAWNQVG